MHQLTPSLIIWLTVFQCGCPQLLKSLLLIGTRYVCIISSRSYQHSYNILSLIMETPQSGFQKCFMNSQCTVVHKILLCPSAGFPDFFFILNILHQSMILKFSYCALHLLSLLFYLTCNDYLNYFHKWYTAWLIKGWH